MFTSTTGSTTRTRRTGIVLPIAASMFSLAPAARAQNFEDCGVLVRGVECVLFQSDNFGLYVLENRGGFEVGQRVFVRGTLEPGCFTFCQQGDGCIENNTISLCFSTGDLNCDGAIDAFDIEPFILALTDPKGYEAAWPDCDIDLADINGDGEIDAFDIEPFIDLLVGP